MESRRKTLPVASGYWKNPFIGAGEDEHRKGSQSERSQSLKAAEKYALDFLNTRFEDYPVVKFSDIYSEENYYYLYKSAKNYMKLLAKDFKLEPNGHDFEELFKQFNCQLPQNQYCELFQKGDTIYFHVVENSFGWELYYIPCKIIHSATGILRDIYADFFALLQHTQRLTPLKEDSLYKIFVSDTYHSSCVDKEERKKLTEEYESGYIGDILERIAIEPKISITKIKNRIIKYNPRSKQESGILALMLEGLELFKRKKKIMDYNFFPYETEDYYNNYCPVEIYRNLMIIYDDDMVKDMIYNWTIDEANEQNTEIFSGGNLLITPRTRTPLKVDNYVIDFFNWLKKIENELHDL